MIELLGGSLGPRETHEKPKSRYDSSTLHRTPLDMNANGPLAGRHVVVTGTVQTGMQRKDAEARVEEAGGTNLKSLTKKCDLVVVGDVGAGKKKIEEAEEKNVVMSDGATVLRICAGEEEVPPPTQAA